MIWDQLFLGGQEGGMSMVEDRGFSGQGNYSLGYSKDGSSIIYLSKPIERTTQSES